MEIAMSPANSPYVRHSMSRIGDLSDSATRPTAAPSPGTEACAFGRIVSWSKIVPAAFCATATSAVSPCPDSIKVRATFIPSTKAAHPPLCKSSTQFGFMPGCAIRRRRRRTARPALNVGDQDVDVRDGVLAVAFDEAAAAVPPCRWPSRPRPRGGGTSAP
jgi:hypothetical protein